MLTAVAVAGIIASFVALTFLRIGPGGQQFAQQLTGTSDSVAAQKDLSQNAVEAGKAKPMAQAVKPRSGVTAAKTHEVMMMNMAFSPASLEVNVGDTVTWTNHDEAPHNVIVTNGPEKISSPTLEKGEKYSHTFTKAGKNDYYCSIHPNMKASVTVVGGSEPSPTPTTTPTKTPTPTPTDTPTTTPTPTPTDTTEPPDDCAALAETVDTVLAHVYAAHLERSPSGQITDILDLDQYVLTHTVWIESLLKPQLTVLTGSSSEAVDVFLQHLYAAHLERSLSGQVADIADVDQYVLTHTVMIEDMLKPLADAELGSC
jgi:plastocyanin